MDSDGDLFISDTSNHRVRRVSATTGIVTTFAGGGACCTFVSGVQATAAYIGNPGGLDLDSAGNLYIVAGDQVLKVTAATGIINVVAETGSFGYSGDGGAAISAQLNRPEDIVVDPTGDIYIADTYNHRIRKVAATTGIITTFAGTGVFGFSGNGGPATAARMHYPSGVGLGPTGQLFLSDSGNHRIRVVDPVSLLITTAAGTSEFSFIGEGGPAPLGTLWNPTRLAVDAIGNILVADNIHSRIRRISATDGRITTVAGSGQWDSGGDGGVATAAPLANPIGIDVGPLGQIYLAETNRVRRLTPSVAPASLIVVVAGLPGMPGFTGDGGSPLSARLRSPQGLATDSEGNLYIADTANHAIRRIDAATGLISTLCGTGSSGSSGDSGLAVSARLYSPGGVTVDPAGHVYIADTSNHRIRRIDAGTGVITTVAGTGQSGFSGDGGLATQARLQFPEGVSIDSNGVLYVADTGNDRIRRVDLHTNIVTTLAGNGSRGFSGDGGPAFAARLSRPRSVAVDASSNVWIADSLNNRLRWVEVATGTITTVAGTGTSIFNVTGGPALSSGFTPARITVAPSGDVVVVDSNEFRALKLSVSSGLMTVIAGSNNNIFGGDRGISTAAQLRFPRGVAVNANGDIWIADTDNHVIRALFDTVSAPAVVTQPAPRMVTAGSNASFFARVSGRLPPLLQWQSSSDGGATYVNLVEGTGAIGTTLSQLTVLAPSLALNGTRYRLVATNSEGSVTSAAAVLTVREPLTAAPGTLRFAARKQGETLTAVTAPQTLTISMGATASAWTVSSDQPWLALSSTGGTGPGAVTASVSNPADVLGTLMSASATITITAPDAPNPTTTVPVFLSIQPVEAPASAPIGRVDSPAQNTTGAQGALAMTGWAVDDIGIDRVRIYRQCLPFDNPAACRTVVGASLVYLGDASVIPGARPDVEAAFPALPAANAAGWGFLILTNVLPHIPNATSTGGVGTFHLHAVALDREGNEKLLGRTAQTSEPTTVTVANDTIAKPFGSIDTPGQGATASGVLNNFGWVITPDTPAPGTLVPLDGSTITVYIDGAAVGTAQYNLCRGTVGNPVPVGVLCNDDVSNRFRGDGTRFRNLDAARGPIGLRPIDTTTLANGLHTISWGVRDSADRVEGIGSRFFTVLNAGARPAGIAEPRDSETSEPRDLGTSEPRDSGTPVLRDPGTPIWARTGYDEQTAYTPLEPNAEGVPQVRIPEHGRVELQIPGVVGGSMIANGTVRDLPVGVGIDRERGIVTWVAGPGYLGTYRLRFEVPESRGPEVLGAPSALTFVWVDITVASASTVGGNVRMRVDRADVHGAVFTLHGWALDPQAATGAGIGTVHVWARRRSPEVPGPARRSLGAGGSRGSEVPGAAVSERSESKGPIFLGIAQLGVPRPDVAAAHGAHMPNAGFVLQGVLPEAGEWELTAYVWVTRTGRFEDARSLTVTRR